jgi:hypothetical protein
MILVWIFEKLDLEIFELRADIIELKTLFLISEKIGKE